MFLKDGKVITYALVPLSDATWDDMREAIKHEEPKSKATIGDADEGEMPTSETNSMYDVTRSATAAKHAGVILDASREVRIKLYMGQASSSFHSLFA